MIVKNGSKLKNIVLVDDESGVLSALKMLLSALGFSPITFNDPEEALRTFHLHPTAQVVISDLRMPKIDGISLLSEIKKVRPDIPVILMSGHATGEEIFKAQSLGASGFLAKPFTPEQFFGVLDSIEVEGKKAEAV